jgi:metal-dependent amidase/aminoacylase/carboxypeptidase family protein
MPIIPRLRELQPELARIRRDIHAHPELGFARLAERFLAEELFQAPPSTGE